MVVGEQGGTSSVRGLSCFPEASSVAVDCGQLVAVTHENDPYLVFIGDRQQCQRRALVEHPGLVDEQNVPGSHARSEIEVIGSATVPVAVLVPAISVLACQPVSGAG